jgi:hypothetical protein
VCYKSQLYPLESKKHIDIVNEVVGRVATTMEGKNILTLRSHIELVWLVGAVAGVNGGNLLAVPHDINERASLQIATEGTGVEELNGVFGASCGVQWFGGCERARKSIKTVTTTEGTNAIASEGIAGEVEDQGILLTTRRGCSDPVGVRLGEAEVGATTASETFEATVDDQRRPLVATRESDFEVALTGVDSGGGIGNKEVLSK